MANNIQCPSCGLPISGVKCEHCGANTFFTPERKAVVNAAVPLINSGVKNENSRAKSRDRQKCLVCEAPASTKICEHCGNVVCEHCGALIFSTVDFVKSDLDTTKNLFTFNGRTARKKYWVFCLYSLIVFFIIFCVLPWPWNRETSFDYESIMRFRKFFTLLFFVIYIPMAVRRLHDIGKSGWHIFIVLVPVAGWIRYLVWTCSDSQAGENMYGPNPEDDANAKAFSRLTAKCFHRRPPPPRDPYFSADT